MKLLTALCVIASSFTFAAPWQTKEASQWVIRYRGGGTVSVLEGRRGALDPLFGASGSFVGYEYRIESYTGTFWGVYPQVPALVLVENGDPDGRLVITPKRGVAAFTQPVQIMGSNASFKSIIVKAPRDADQMVFGLMAGAAVMIDGDVAKFTTTARLLASQTMMRNVGSFACRSMYYSFMILGTPQQYVSNAYVSYEGETNGVVTFTGGDLGRLKVAGAIQDTFVFAGASPAPRLFTSDLDALYNVYPPSGSIGKVQARSLCGVGRFIASAAKWLPTCYMVGSAAPVIKIPATRIITEGSSVYINH